MCSMYSKIFFNLVDRKQNDNCNAESSLQLYQNFLILKFDFGVSVAPPED